MKGRQRSSFRFSETTMVFSTFIYRFDDVLDAGLILPSCIQFFINWMRRISLACISKTYLVKEYSINLGCRFVEATAVVRIVSISTGRPARSFFDYLEICLTPMSLIG